MKKWTLLFCVCLLFSMLVSYVPVSAKSSIDIVFIIDRSGSMGDDIDAVQDNITWFANRLEDRGVDYQLGLLSYEKYVSNYGMTKDVNEFIQDLNRIDVDGGTENGRDAIAEALNFTFDLNAAKYFILIGDEVITSRRGYSDSEIIRMLQNEDVTFTAIGEPGENDDQLENYTDATGGQFLSIHDDYADNLTDILDELQRRPILEIIDPVNGQTISGSNYIPKVRVSDPDSDRLDFSFYIGSESNLIETKSVTNTQTAQTVSFSALDTTTLSDGTHRFIFKVDDGEDYALDYVDVSVDNHAPVLQNVQFVPSDTSIHISGSASDSVSGLHPYPYRYRVGSVVSGWTNQTSFLQSALTPNTRYEAAFEARDVHGQVAETTRTLHTLAQRPSMQLSSSGETSMTIAFNDQNPSSTPYQLRVGGQYVDGSGNLTGSAVWITPSNKTITVKGLASGQRYAVYARARNSEGQVTDWRSASFYTLPQSPSDIETDEEQRSITVSWSAVSGAHSYDIEVDGTVRANGSSTTFVHSGLNPNTQHTYRVRANNPGGKGNWSPLVTTSTLPDPPPVPVGLQTDLEQTQVTLTWNRVAEATAYEVEADGVVESVGDTTTFVHQGLEPESAHTYRVRAKNPGGISAWSAPVNVVTLPYPPETPTGIATQLNKNWVKLTWDEMARAEAYEIEVDGLIIDNGNVTTYTHDGLEPLSGHTYRIRAKNRGGKSPWSAPIDVTTYPEEPNEPTNLMTTAEETAVTLTWYQVEHAESYEVEIDGGAVVQVTDASYTHTGLEPDSEHTYRVRAKNVSGYSEWSRPATMRTFPEGEGTEAFTNVAAVVTNTFITLSWDTVAPDAEYEIEVDGELLDNGTDTIYHHGGLQANEFHTYRIRLKDGGSSRWVAVLSLSTLPDPPDAPEGLEAYAQNTRIELRWERVEGASGYEIEVDGETIDVGNNESYVHEGLTPGTSHTYRVRAKNITGVTAWSPALTKSTTSPLYTVKVNKDEPFDFTLLASNVQDFSELTFVVTYDPEEVELTDLHNFTPEADVMSDGPIPGTNMTVHREAGRIEITVSKNIVPGTSWSGEITTLQFRPKIDGETDLEFVVE